MTVDGNQFRRSMREYLLDFRPSSDENGDFDELSQGFHFKSREIYRPGDIVYVKVRSSRHVENPDEAFRDGKTKEVLREGVVTLGRLWKPGKYSDLLPESGKKILGLSKRNAYLFKYRKGLNDPELRKNYWKMITNNYYDWSDIRKKLSSFGELWGRERVEK